MRHRRTISRLHIARTLSLAATIAVTILAHEASPAWAQNPTFKYGDQKEVKDVDDVEWKALAQSSLVFTTGNSETTTLSGGAAASRKTGQNKLSMEANGAYTRSTLYLVQDLDGDGMIQDDEITRVRDTTAKGWLVRARFDRFLTEHNSLYAMVQISADEPAGKELVAGGQVGYSRQLYKSDRHELVSEVGYDYSYENQIVGDGVSIHSGRVFLGYQGKLTDATNVIGSGEMLSNVNSLGDEVDAFEDTRVNAGLAISTTVYKNISLRFGFGLKYDNAPAINPTLQRPADKLDTKTEAVVVVNFL